MRKLSWHCCQLNNNKYTHFKFSVNECTIWQFNILNIPLFFLSIKSTITIPTNIVGCFGFLRSNDVVRWKRREEVNWKTFSVHLEIRISTENNLFPESKFFLFIFSGIVFHFRIFYSLKYYVTKSISFCFRPRHIFTVLYSCLFIRFFFFYQHTSESFSHLDDSIIFFLCPIFIHFLWSNSFKWFP